MHWLLLVVVSIFLITLTAQVEIEKELRDIRARQEVQKIRMETIEDEQKKLVTKRSVSK